MDSFGEEDTNSLVRRASSFNLVRDLCRAVTRGNVESTRALLEEQKVSPNLTHRDMPVLNFLATVGCHDKNVTAEIVALLIKHGAEVTALDGSGCNIFHSAAGLQDPELLQLLIDAVRADGGADLSEMINAEGFQGATAIHVAARIPNNAASVAVLIGTGVCDVNARSGAGITPLHDACWALDPAIVQLLLDAGADPNALYAKSGRHVTPGSIMAEHVDSFGGEETDVILSINKMLKEKSAIQDAAERPQSVEEEPKRQLSDVPEKAASPAIAARKVAAAALPKPNNGADKTKSAKKSCDEKAAGKVATGAALKPKPKQDA